MENTNEQAVVASKNTKSYLPLILGIVLVLVIGISFFVFVNGKNGNMGSQKSSNSVIADQTKIIALAEVASHNTSEDCWTSINGDVFDVTKFVSKHKGGDKILAVCGIDGTDLFTGKSPMGRVHSQMAVKLLGSMKIGQLQ